MDRQLELSSEVIFKMMDKKAEHLTNIHPKIFDKMTDEDKNKFITKLIGQNIKYKRVSITKDEELNYMLFSEGGLEESKELFKNKEIISKIIQKGFTNIINKSGIDIHELDDKIINIAIEYDEDVSRT